MGNQKMDSKMEPGTWQEKLEELQKVVTKTRKIWLAGGAMVGIGFSMAAGGNASGVIAAFIGLVVFLIGFSRFMKADKAMKGIATESIVGDMASQVFDDVECQVDEMIPEEVLKRYAPISMDQVTSLEGNTHIQAVYREHKIEMGNVKLNPKFHGFCIMCNLRQSFHTEIIIKEKNLNGQPFAKSKVGSVNERFTKLFEVEAGSMDEAARLLTDNVKKHLIKMNEYTYGNLCFHLFQNGGVSIGINNGRDGFDLSNIKTVNAADLQKKFQTEALLYSAILDEVFALAAEVDNSANLG